MMRSKSASQKQGRRLQPARPLVQVAGFDDLDPRIRWWTDIVRLTNPMNATEGLTVLGESTTNMIISNLQGQGEVEGVQSLLSFVGLFIAELLRAVHEAEHGDIVHLMQQAVSVGPGSFAKVLVQLQADLEKMGKERSRKAARDMARLLHNLGNVDIGKRTMDRKSRLAALLVAYSKEESPSRTRRLVRRRNSNGNRTQDWLWARVLPYPTEGQGADLIRERASSSGDAAGALDEADEAEGILVKRGPQLPWEKPTPDQELRHHDEQVREERSQQERDDQEAYQRFRASQMQEWEDWAMSSEMNVVPKLASKTSAHYHGPGHGGR